MIKKTKKFILFFLVSSLLAEDNGWYMSVGYQIGGTQQFINNKQLLENENIINSVTQSAINVAGPTTGLITLSSQSVIDALGYGVSNTVGNQLEGISNILNQIGKRKDFYSSRQISSISQQIIGLKGSSDPLKAHSSQITAKLLSNTQSTFDQGIALSSSIISSVNSLNPSNNTKEVKAQLQNTAQSMAELLQQIENSITKTTSTTYAQSLLTNLTDAVNASSNNTAYVSALVNALNTLGVGVFPTTTSTHVVLNPPGQIVFYPANSILGSTSSNSNNQQQYNNTLLMNTLQGELSANNQINPNGCTNQVQCLEQFIQNLSPLTTTPTSNNQANQQVQAIAQKLQSVAINALDNNAINNTTYNLNNLHNALNFQAYESTITQYNNALSQISWISFSEPKNLLKNTSNNYQIGTVTNAQGQNISAYDCMTATGSLSSDASSGISCSATSSTSATNGSTNSFDNSLVATSKVQTINGKEQIGVNSFNLVSQVWSVYNSLKTSEENLQKNAKILCANGSSSGTSSCGNSGGLSISGNAQLQNILSSTNGTTAQAKSNASKLKAMVVVNNEEEAKTANLAQNSGATNQSPSSTVMGALNTVLQNVNNFQQSIQNAFQSQSSNIQAWANALYNTSNPNGSQSQNLTTNNNQDLRIQLRANFYQLINTIDQQVPTSVQAMINQSQQTQQTSGATNNNPCANGMNGSNNTNWCYQQWSDSKAYYSGLQSALGYQTQATTQSGSSGGNSITYNVQQITLTSGGLLNQIITNLKGVNGGNGASGTGSGNGSQINTAYQMLTDASDGKLGTYNSNGNSGSNNGYQTCTNGSNGASGSNCYTPNKQSATSATTATTTDSNLQKVYNDAQKIADIIASSGNNKGVENGLKQFFDALKSSNGTLNSLCTSGSGGNSSSGSTCSGGLINLLGAIPTNGVSDTNNLVNLLTEFIKTAGFIQNNDNSVSTSLTSAFQAITSAISQGFQSLQNDINPNAILTLLQEITSNTTTIQSFSQTLRQLLGDKTFFMVQQKLIDAMINARNQVQNAQNQANNYGSQPILSQYAAAKSTQHGMSNGLGVGLGYKYFFGKARKLGLRHYIFFDYGFSEIGVANQSVKTNIFAYGIGTDFLWNLFRRTYNTKALNFGLFAGVQLGGATWLSSLRQQIIDNWGNANDIHSTNFQVALNFGVRTNFAEFKRFAEKFHNQGVISQKSVEFGIKVPLINQAYLSSAGADVSYRRLYAFYINYIMGF
ncbi:Hop family outer membrane protein HopL [Helicobacter pylori]|nr:Hop family outer membrane protein HopL [Helicobacter pylori]